MFQQQVSSKKERNKLPKFSAPANMVSLRTPSSSNAMAGSSTLMTASNNGSIQATSSSSSSQQQPPPQHAPGALSGLSTDASTHPSKSTAASSDLGLPSRQYASLTSSKSSTNPSHTHPHPAYIATKDAIPAPLPGPSQQMADIPHASFTSPHQHKLSNGSAPAAPSSVNGSQDGSRSGRVPQSKRAPVDPFDAPAVTFRSSLSPPSGLAIPDIPYGQGRGPLPRKSSGSIASVAGSRAASTKSSRAKVFTPSDAHTGIRKIPGQEGVMENKRALQENTSRNAGSNDYNLVTVASSASAGQPHPAPAPSTTLFTPSAPLTVTAPVVTGQSRKATQIDQEHLAEWRQEHEPSGVLTAGNTIVVTSPSAASKQPTKSAMKGGNSQAQARSWADLVRPMSHVQLAEQAVKNIGLTDAEISARDKEQTEVSERERMQQEAKAANEAAKKKRVSIALPGTAASPATTAPASTTAVSDKVPRHSSPPPAGPSGTGTGDAAVPVSAEAAAQPAAAKDTTDTRSLASNATGGSALFSNVMSRKKNLEEILAGVENSRSTVLLYPRGLVNTGNACFMNSILQTLLFTAPFYNLINLIGSNTAEDLSGKTPLLDAMVSYLAEFRTHDSAHEHQLRSGESYEQELNRNDAFIPSIIYHALNKNARFAQMGFANPSSASSRGTSLSNGAYGSGSAVGAGSGLGSHVYRPPSVKHQHGAGGYLSQEDAQEFLGFFLDTIHEELLIKIDQFDKQNWERASKGYRAGMDSLTRQSVNSAAAYDAITAPAGAGQQPAVGASSASVRSASNTANGGAEDDEWLEVGQKGRTANTRTTEHQESAITKIFGGQLRSVLRCPGQKDSVTLEPFMSLQLEIEQPNVYTIEDALSFISKPETLSDVANRNNLKGDATKQLFIDTLPPVLILHLKRFVYDSRAGGVLKSHKVVSYGTELEVPKDCLAPAKRTSAQMARKNHYRLNGVVFHHGKSAAGGHYTVLQRQNNGRWLNIDDTTITPVPVEEVVVDRDRENMRLSLPSASNLRGVPEKSAYLLFYQRV